MYAHLPLQATLFAYHTFFRFRYADLKEQTSQTYHAPESVLAGDA